MVSGPPAEGWRIGPLAALKIGKDNLPLVSANYIASDFCFSVEMIKAIERHDVGTAVVIPIILKPVDWKSAPFGKLQALPKDGLPVSKWTDRDEAFMDAATGIRRVIETRLQ